MPRNFFPLEIFMLPNYDIPFHPSPCEFKRECKECVMTDVVERPNACVGLVCDQYTPCKKCGANRTLNEKHLCSTCGRDQTLVTAKTKDGVAVEVPRSMARTTAELDSEEVKEFNARPVSLTQPGNPPTNYTEEEKKYYQSQWDEYRNFYRDPTTKALCHQIIIMEVELGWLTNYMINHRGQPNKEHEQQRNRIIKNISELRNQLPEKEATEESDDERFLSMIYERYLQEKNDRTLNGVRRVFSQDAIAIAPCLTFPLNPQALLEKLGYKTIEAVQAVQSLKFEGLPSDPRKLLEFLGYYLDEKFALPYTPDTVLKEEALPDTFEVSVGDMPEAKEADPTIDE